MRNLGDGSLDAAGQASLKPAVYEYCFAANPFRPDLNITSLFRVLVADKQATQMSPAGPVGRHGVSTDTPSVLCVLDAPSSLPHPAGWLTLSWSVFLKVVFHGGE